MVPDTEAKEEGEGDTMKRSDLDCGSLPPEEEKIYPEFSKSMLHFVALFWSMWEDEEKRVVK